VLSPTAPSAQITPSPSGAEKQVKQMLDGRLRRGGKISQKYKKLHIYICEVAYFQRAT
jgi:hypothetical protein